MRILFITATRIGDAVLSTGILGHLIDANPGARVTVACGSAPASLFAALPGLERVIVLEKRRLAGHWLGLWAGTVPRLWDMVVDLRGSALAYLLVARGRRVMHGGRQPGHRLAQLSRLLGLDDPASPRVWLEPRHQKAAARLIPGGGPVVGLGPTANWPAKIWPAERFARLFRNLSGRDGPLPGARAAVFGGPGERPLAAPLLDALAPAGALDLVNKADLLTIAACLRRCDLYVGNDSGLMHLAAAAGTPTLGLFGPSRPEEYAPWGAHAAAVRTEIPFEELMNADFDHRNAHSLMGSLKLETVEAAARLLIAEAQGAAA